MKIKPGDYYQILGVSQTASKQSIRAAYLKLAKRYHPDSSTGCAESFKLVNSAYETLHDDAKRSMYRTSYSYTQTRSHHEWHQTYEQQQQYQSTPDDSKKSNVENEQWYKDYQETRRRYRDVFTMHQYDEKYKHRSHEDMARDEETYAAQGTMLGMTWVGFLSLMALIYIGKWSGLLETSGDGERKLNRQKQQPKIASSWGNHEKLKQHL